MESQRLWRHGDHAGCSGMDCSTSSMSVGVHLRCLWSWCLKSWFRKLARTWRQRQLLASLWVDQSRKLCLRIFHLLSLSVLLRGRLVIIEQNISAFITELHDVHQSQSFSQAIILRSMSHQDRMFLLLKYAWRWSICFGAYLWQFHSFFRFYFTCSLLNVSPARLCRQLRRQHRGWRSSQRLQLQSLHKFKAFKPSDRRRLPSFHLIDETKMILVVEYMSRCRELFSIITPLLFKILQETLLFLLLKLLPMPLFDLFSVIVQRIRDVQVSWTQFEGVVSPHDVFAVYCS